ncbi:MAG: hypothetical protein ACQET1_08065 [Gemmatimonadota bacterium]
MVVRIHPGQLLPSCPEKNPGPSFSPGPVALLVLVLCLFGSGSALAAQNSPDTLQHAPGVTRDSTALREEAREAQERFERFHRSRLPRTLRPWQGSCDERLGSICLRFDGSSDWEPAPEDSLITARREELLETLRRVGEVIPGDQWVLGQRIRYLGDLSRWSSALALAEACEGPPEWWCSGLVGYVHHRAGRTLEAAEAFGASLEQMEPSRAETWIDPGILLDYQGDRWLKNPGDIPREAAIHRFWILSDPLFLTPGNERLTEHFSRRFAATFFADSEMTLGVRWGKSLEAVVVRYGFGVGWERSVSGMQEVGGGSVVEHHHPESRGLLPQAEALTDPAGTPKDAWIPEDERPRSASAPVLAPLVVQGQAEAAVLRRDGDLLVVAAYGVPDDTLLFQRRGNPKAGEGDNGPPPFGAPIPEEASTDTLAGLFLLADTGGSAPVSVMGTGGEGVLQLRAPPGRYLLSMELWNPAGRWGARTRQGVAAENVPPDVPFLSDLLLLDPGPEVPESLEDALPLLRSHSDLSGGGRVTVAWEVYGLGFQEESLPFRLRLIREEDSLIRRAFTRLGLFDREPALALSWTEDGPEHPGPFFRALDLDLPDLDPGPYVLHLELNIPYRTQVLSRRHLTVH